MDPDLKKQTVLKPKEGLTWIKTITKEHLNRFTDNYTPKTDIGSNLNINSHRQYYLLLY